MKYRVLFLMIMIGLSSLVSNAQRGVRVAYIDTEYILENVPEYQEASNQLEKKAQDWKAEIEQRLSVVDQKKNQLDNERVLLTKELYEERLEDIAFEEQQILDYQQKRFGPEGDLITQKRQLIQPIQDQIFSAVQEIAANKKYDFVFDKSADLVMLYSSERYDISELVIRSITRASKRTQAQNRAERRAAEDEEVVPEINEELEEREAALQAKQDARAKAIEDRKAAQQKRRDSLEAAAEARRQKILEERAKAKAERDSIRAAKSGKTNEKDDADAKKDGDNDNVNQASKTEEKTPEQIAEERRQQKLKEREARQKELEERRQRILAEREKAKKEREAQNKEKDSTGN
ncbi:OmpH family outer membrane protein [Mangrovimonas sp. YM274]|uniref:OmpH family outer membrane protein n=1 Tax=Mangrovimonas sp. YM274 TaxID=3070660 RepID=UPI0027DD5ADE|nr:OmpH family outer membrane protein [Mangrovimonas sp. YM274]WMI69431.1 OmpH family outer membrane protein [Mangrovimonas sp. YM274]